MTLRLTEAETEALRTQAEIEGQLVVAVAAGELTDVGAIAERLRAWIRGLGRARQGASRRPSASTTRSQNLA
jgi:predicted TIM-barrel fold metal-dependent hydrolase